MLGALCTSHPKTKIKSGGEDDIGPKVSDGDYRLWVEAFRKAMATPGYSKLLEERGLAPFPLSGPELEAFVKASVAEYRRMAVQLGLQVPRNR